VGIELQWERLDGLNNLASGTYLGTDKVRRMMLGTSVAK
jgi:hypothetical protein